MLCTWLAALALAGTPTPVVLPPTPRFRHYGVAQGMPSSRVYTTAQDHDGYIWVGTGDGLARFDGIQFKLFRHLPDDPKSIAANDVSALLVDQAGRVWAGGEDNGLNLFDPATGGFRHWRHAAADGGSLAGDDVMGIAQTSDGSIWVGIYGSGVDRLTADATHFVHVRHHADDPGSLVSDNVAALNADAQGRLWIGTNHGVDLREADGTLRHIRFAGVSKAPVAWQIDGSGSDVRVATNVGLFVVGADAVARRLPALADMRDPVYSSFRAADGNLWVGVGGGLRLLVVDGHQYVFQSRRLLPGGLPGQVVVDVSRDREGGLWLSTLDAGLVYLAPHWRDFTSFRHIPEESNSLRDSRILALAQAPGGALLVGGPEGQLDRLDPRSGGVEHLGKTVRLPAKSVNSLLVDGRGRTWIGLQRSLRVLDHGKLQTVGTDVLNNGVVWLLPAPDGGVYAAPTAQGVFHVDPDTLKLTALPLASTTGAARETEQMLLHDGELWRASRAGLSRWQPDALHMEFVPGVSRGLVDAMGFHGDDLWLARSDALEHYRWHAGHATRVARITADQGWPSFDFNGMFVDSLGRVWLTSRVGLWRFDPQSKEFRRYGSVDGLPSSGFNGPLIVTHNGTVYAGTTGGIVAFRPAALNDAPSAPALLLSAVSVRRDGREVALPLTDGRLDLGWNDRDLRVTVKALSYIDPAANHYRFRLVGLDNNWVDTGTRGEREFAGLAAGNYSLRVEAAGPSGAWARLRHAWPVHIAAPPWETPWAWLLYALVSLLLIWLVWRIAQRRVEQRYHLRMVVQASAAKTRFLATLGHEIRTPMTGVLGMAELLMQTPLEPRQRGFVQTIQRSGGVLLKLVNDALDMARIETGRLPLDIAPFDPAALLREVAALDAGLAEAKGLALTVEIDGVVPHWVSGDVIRVKQILLNLTGNAVKFTDVGSVCLMLAWRDAALVYKVRDSGPGLAESDRNRLFRRFEQGARDSGSGGSGLGLAICRELATLMGGSVDVESQAGQGSTFRVRLPLPEASAGPEAQATREPLASLHVMLVEDDPVVGEVISGLLEAQGHTVSRASHALAALSKLALGEWDVVLVDLDLPDVDGFELMRMLRRQPRHAGLAIVVVTARTESSDEKEALAAGADAFLRKPVSGEQLAAALAEVLAARDGRSQRTAD